MHKKGKNKKGKPIISQNEAKSEEKVEEAEVKSVEEMPAPEIVSEEITETKEEAPKKPKRNKGKKKKDSDDLSDNIEDTSKQDDTGEIIPKAVNVPEESETVMPVTRKKKNKKKSDDQCIEISSNKDLPTVSYDGKAKQVSLPEEKENIPKVESQEQEVKSSKKKNKKKKRNDSEKSNKDELSCTTAFQKLLDTTSDPKAHAIDESKDQPPLDISLDNIVEVKHEESKDSLTNTEINFSTAIEMSNTDQEATKSPAIAESKSKAKNKKDKKQAKNENDSHSFQKPTTECLPTNIQLSTEVITKDCINITGPEPEESTSKAKIAKPVDKKRKHDAKVIHMTENILDSTNTQDNSETSPSIEIKDVKEQAITKVLHILDSPLRQPKEEDNTKLLELQLPDKPMDKKRQKTPKVQKHSDMGEAHEQSLKIILETKIPHKETIMNVSEVSPNIEFHKQTTKINLEQLIPKPLQEATKESKCEEKLELPLNLTEAIDTTTEIKEKVGIAPGKKRKKSPKLPFKPEKSEQLISELSDTKHDIKEESTDDLLKMQSSKEYIGTEKDVTINISKLEDIEIRSVKTDESEDSTCEVTPDISYPRSASQQLLDNNNNMVIREILPAEQNVLTDIPLVLGLVESPKTPEPDTDKNVMVEDISSSVLLTFTETEPSLNKKTKESKHKEKTDLKSKMMEVNKDMEGLRMSIEKSLAEFTAIEKSEEEIEKDFEKVKDSKEISVASTTKATDETSLITTETAIAFNPSPKTVPADINSPKNDIIKHSYEECYKLKDLESENINKPNIDEIMEAAALRKDKQVETPVTTETAVQHPELKGTIASTLLHEMKNEPVNILTKNSDAQQQTIPTAPARKDHKGKHKKKRGKQEGQTTQTTAIAVSTTTSTTETKDAESKDTKTEPNESKTENNNANTEKSKQQSDKNDIATETEYEPIEHFEDALTSSVDDVNKTFEMIVNDGNAQTNPKINIIAPDDDKINKVQPPKNLLGHPDFPVSSNKRDYKKEKNKSPNETQAKVKIKDCIEVEKSSKNTQTLSRIIKNCNNDATSNEEYVYKYSFRKVFLQSSCHVCKKDLAQRVSCGYCNLVFYCSVKHKDEDWPRHQALCFAVSTLVHLKDQKHIYGDAKNITGHDYRLLRMQMIVSCEKVLKRRLVPWEQEALLYPRMCAMVGCREWKQAKLKDCEGCGQISFCKENPDHLPKSHQRWCKSYSLYQKLVSYQQTKGRLEPKLPSRVMKEQYQMPEKINEVLAAMYEEKIDMNDIEYAALTQIATAPLTAAYGYQVYRSKNPSANGVSKKSSLTIHVVGAELQFEADALVKWEVFFLHLQPELQELKIVLTNSNLNPSNLPLDLLGKIKLCDNCRKRNRRVIFSFQDKRTYPEYRISDDFIHPDLVCAFNPSIQRSSIYNGKDPWPATINSIIKLKAPWIITAYSITELHRDSMRIKECSEAPYSVVSEPKYNSFASVRPDRNFISDDEMPLLFKNYCYMILCG